MTEPLVDRHEDLWDMCNEIKGKLEYNQHAVTLDYHGLSRYDCVECTVTVATAQGNTFQWHVDGTFDPTA